MKRLVTLPSNGARKATRLATLGTALVAVLLAGCAGSTSSEVATPSAMVATSTGIASGGSSLPLGDGKIGLSAQIGSVMVCSLTFAKEGGAEHAGPWIDANAGTWIPSKKVAVQGSVNWPQAHFQVKMQGSTRTVTTNDLPVNEPTGVFPIASNDPAYAYDRNPNHIAAQSLSYALPANPTPAAEPACLHGGPIGVTLDGVVLFDALDASGRDAVAHEVQDRCDGHPDGSSMYHYHSVSPCLMTSATGTSTLVGYALDGYGIYVERSANGALLTDSDLDACHGRVSTVEWDGKPASVYHYDATAEYPYTLGCFKGKPVVTSGPHG